MTVHPPSILSASFIGVRSEVLLHSLEDRQIYVSAGSACSSNHPSYSSTLQSIGLKPEQQESTLRFSFCVHTTKEELDYTHIQCWRKFCNISSMHDIQEENTNVSVIFDKISARLASREKTVMCLRKH